MSQTNKAAIVDPSISIKISEKLRSYISKVKVSDDLPIGISNIVFKNKPKNTNKSSPTKIYRLITEDDEHYIKSVSLGVKKNILTELPSAKPSEVSSTDTLLSLEDLHWLYKYLHRENESNDEKVYLHELLEGSEIVFPKNEEIPRSEELEKRCNRLKAEQENLAYFKMTKNIDSKRKVHPEDTIGYQLKQINRHLIAVFQFIVSVAAGFAFGFIGVELLIGNLDFGFRLLLGIICALTIALAELYFLAKKLNEDLQFEYNAEKQNKKGLKLD